MKKKNILKLFTGIIICITFNILLINAATEDKNPPVLNDFKLITTEVIEGDYAEFTIDATDDVSGIWDIQLSFVNDNDERFYTSLKPNDTSFLVPSGTKAGEYKLEYIYMFDKENNAATYVNEYNLEEKWVTPPTDYFNYGDLKIIVKTKGGIADIEPPVLNSVQMEKQTLKYGETQKFIVSADDVSGISKIYVSIKKLIIH